MPIADLENHNWHLKNFKSSTMQNYTPSTNLTTQPPGMLSFNESIRYPDPNEEVEMMIQDKIDRGESVKEEVQA